MLISNILKALSSLINVISRSVDPDIIILIHQTPKKDGVAIDILKRKNLYIQLIPGDNPVKCVYVEKYLDKINKSRIYNHEFEHVSSFDTLSTPEYTMAYLGGLILFINTYCHYNIKVVILD